MVGTLGKEDSPLGRLASYLINQALPKPRDEVYGNGDCETFHLQCEHNHPYSSFSLNSCSEPTNVPTSNNLSLFGLLNSIIPRHQPRFIGTK